MAEARTEVVEARGSRGLDYAEDHDVGQAPLPRRLAAEFLGTLLLVAVGAGTVTGFLSGPANRFGALTSGQVDALSGAPQEEVLFTQFFANTFGDLLPVALAFAFILAVGIYALGGVSGAHFNPAVTLALAAVRRFSWKEVPLYWIVQILGGIAGAFVLMAIFGDSGATLVDEVPQVDPATGQPTGTSEIVTNIMYGATTVADGIERWNAILAEAFITFILVMTIMAIAVDRRAPKGWSGLVIGLSLAAGIMVTGLITGGSANFARSLGPFVVSMVNDVKDIPWEDLIVYAAGPLIGGVAAAFVYEGVSGMERVAPSPSPGAATPEPDLLDDDEDPAAAGTRRTAPPPPPA